MGHILEVTVYITPFTNASLLADAGDVPLCALCSPVIYCLHVSAVDRMVPVGGKKVQDEKERISLDSTIDSIMNSPTTGNDNTNNSNQLQSQTSPTSIQKSSISATVRYESDFTDLLESPPPQSSTAKPSKRLPILRSRRIGIDPTAGTSQSNKKVMSPSNSRTPNLVGNKVAPLEVAKPHKPSIGQNKVAPLDRSNTLSPPAVVSAVLSSSEESAILQVPPENQVVCTVDIHREKSPSVTSSIVSGINSPRD